MLGFNAGVLLSYETACKMNARGARPGVWVRLPCIEIEDDVIFRGADKDFDDDFDDDDFDGGLGSGAVDFEGADVGVNVDEAVVPDVAVAVSVEIPVEAAPASRSELLDRIAALRAKNEAKVVESNAAAAVAAPVVAEKAEPVAAKAEPVAVTATVDVPVAAVAPVAPVAPVASVVPEPVAAVVESPAVVAAVIESPVVVAAAIETPAVVASIVESPAVVSAPAFPVEAIVPPDVAHLTPRGQAAAIVEWMGNKRTDEQVLFDAFGKNIIANLIGEGLLIRTKRGILPGS
jgi:hypothetical protein